jgi:hypothetical protein
MPKTCPQCQTEAADAAAFCPSCGATLSPAATASAPPPPPPAAGGAGAPATSSIPAYKFDAARWSLADRIAGIATIVLFISLFLSWFSYNLGIGIYHWSGLSAHWYLYFVLILSIVTVAYLVARAGWDQLPVEANLPHLTVMLTVTVINAVLVVIGFVFKPGGFGISGVGWNFGAFLGLIAALAAAAPYAVPQLRAKTM